jgi:hypothetical protein
MISSLNRFALICPLPSRDGLGEDGHSVGACAALLGFTKLWIRRNAARIPVITRGPLYPLTPPISADKVVLMADLRARNFDKLEATLTAYQSAAEKDVTQETNMVQAFEAFSREDPTFEAPLQEWVSRSPKSLRRASRTRRVSGS